MKTIVGTLVVALFLAVFLSTTALSGNTAADTTLSYRLPNQADGTNIYTLNVIIPRPLTEYYQQQNHRSAADADFPKFVTPYAFQQVAGVLRQIYPVDEDFANGALTLVHQIPYTETLPEFYPVETLARNDGDCDLFSLVVASILEAGGLQVVLLHYASEEHMNIGIHLDDAPKQARTDFYSVTHNNLTYYVAECTSTNWEQGWRVGECPHDLKNAYATVITLDVHEQVSPGQISASFQKLATSNITLNVSPMIALAGSVVNVNGRITPALPNQNVTLYESSSTSAWTIVNTVTTQADGAFTCSWVSQNAGKLNIRAGWTGNDQYAATISPTHSALFVPAYFIVLVGLAATAVTISIVAFALVSHRKKDKPPLAASPQSAV
jgi:hypothetical protein